MIKLLCVDPLEDYELIDEALLQAYGIEPIFLCQAAQTSAPKNHFNVHCFSYEALLAACRHIQPDYIACFSEDLFVVIAKIRAELAIKGMDLQTAMRLSHKQKMYEQLKQELPYPKTTTIHQATQYATLVSELGTTNIFIKPTHLAGSCETYHVPNDEAFNYFLSHRSLDAEHYLAQTFIDAPLYHCELVVFDGEVLGLWARQYSAPNHLMVSQNLPIFSLPCFNQAHYDTIIRASIKAQELLQVRNGILHTEFFLNDNGALHFIETNARAPGIGLNRMYRKKLSISLETLLCFIVCECKPAKIVENKDHYLCGYYPLQPGTVKNINIPSLDVANEWITYVKVNDTIAPAKHMTKSAMVLCWDACSEKIAKAASALNKHNLIEVYQST